MNKMIFLAQDNLYGSNRKYYVYRLIDPRTFHTFYVGKGCGDRALQHAKNVKSLIKAKLLISPDEDELSLKVKLILDIIAAGKEVIIVIHRRGLTEKEALEVESALIDCYPGLTNIQNGYGIERGAITYEDLCTLVNTKPYAEPVDDYVIIKISPDIIQSRGSIYDAVRICWRASLKRAKKYQYVLAVVNGIVQEVYEVDKWYQYNDERIAFEGHPTSAPISSLKGSRIPDYYSQKGAANPFIYKKK